jgi:hypothetical protein
VSYTLIFKVHHQAPQTSIPTTPTGGAWLRGLSQGPLLGNMSGSKKLPQQAVPTNALHRRCAPPYSSQDSGRSSNMCASHIGSHSGRCCTAAMLGSRSTEAEAWLLLAPPLAARPQSCVFVCVGGGGGSSALGALLLPAMMRCVSYQRIMQPHC